MTSFGQIISQRGAILLETDPFTYKKDQDMASGEVSWRSPIQGDVLRPPKMIYDNKVPHSLREIVENLKSSQVKNVVTMVGAGISTAAGIPDFRSAAYGLYGKMKDYNLPSNHSVFENAYFEMNPEPLFVLLKESMLCKDFQPTAAHYFVKLLEDKGVLRRHYTQNIDGLDREAGIASDKLIEAHGSLRTSHCSRCHIEYSLSWLKTEVRTKTIPTCEVCSAVIRPDIVLFGDPLPDDFQTKINGDYANCDLLIVMGTSLVVEPFASLITSVPSSCPRLFINKMPLGDKVNASGDQYKVPDKPIWLGGGNRDTIMHGECDDCVEELASMCSGSVVGATRVSSESTCPMLAGRTRRRAQVQTSAPSRKLRFQLAKERKASTTLGIIMSAFTVCWLPFFVLAVVRPFLTNEDAIPGSLSSLFLWLGYANSLLNPVIYATLNRDFRRPFQQILYFRCGSLNLMMREEFYQSQYGNPNPPHFTEDEPTCDLMPVSEVKQAGNESFL